MRQDILSLLAGQKLSTAPAFSGLIHITTTGLEHEGLAFNEIHKDARQMARAAAATFKLTGLPSAVAPLDMYVEADALGAEIRYYENVANVFPQVAKPLVSSARQLNREFFERVDITQSRRVPLVCEALRLLKAEIGNEAVIGGMQPGPYSLLLFLVEPGGLFTEMKREPEIVLEALQGLAGVLARVGQAYREAGADFITVHDMGGSPAFIGPAKYEQFVYPAEKALLERLPGPRVLSVCGNVTRSLDLLNEVGAEAISIDQTTDAATARTALTNTLLFGNLDPVAVLSAGNEAQVHEAAQKAREAGVDALWPGCDLVPSTPVENIRALLR